MQLKIIVGFLIFAFISIAYGENSAEPPMIGNFILPGSQQPGSLLGLGQTIIDKNETQLSLFTTDFNGENQYAVSVAPSIIYGITDQFSIYLNMPIAASLKYEQDYSSGLQDTFLQFEYAFYASKNHDFSEQATILTGASFPTGSSTKQPPTGFGSPSFSVGATFGRMYTDWLAFTAYGAVLTTSENNTKFGNQFIYQGGIGRNITDIDSRWILAWILEADGQYTQKSKISGITQSDSGGNTVYVIPSLWLSSKTLIIQPGIGIPIIQHLFGEQNKNNYLLTLDLSWSIY